MQKLKLVASNSAPISRQRAIRRSASAGKITHIERDAPNLRVIAALERMLEKARTGDVSGIVAAFIDTDGACTYMLSGSAVDSPDVTAEVTAMLAARFG